MRPWNESGMLHGGDYNPEQWKHVPGIWDEDLRLMNLAHINTLSVGIFSWVSLEPEEGKFEFEWLDDILDRLSRNGQRVNLATPSGAKPAWMSARYPEIRRVQPNGLRDPHQGRHNHCLTSPVYREKVSIINTRLAERYANHPALLMWHVSNEYGGECHCALCMKAFQEWLQRRYSSLDALNKAWWAAFWSHTYTDWSQIDFIDHSVHGLVLDWKRFVTDQTTDFIRNEIAPLRHHTPDVPVTINMMGTYDGLNCWKIAPYLDLVSWDSYPLWHRPGPNADRDTGCETSFVHDIYRSMKNGDPFLLMESTPSMQNWAPVCKQKRPGMHQLSSLLAVAHGSDGVLYFQYRKSRGSAEKFHGAVVDHVGHEHNRVFREVADLGEKLERLGVVAGSRSPAEVAILFDWENRWAIEGAAGPCNAHKDYVQTCVAHYRPFWKRGITVDVIDSTCDFSGYKLLIAPMLYMIRPGVAERMTAFVEAGGTFVTTYLSGVADENDLCFLTGFPGPLRPLLGIWSEEMDALYDEDVQTVIPLDDNDLGLDHVYDASHICEIIHAESARVLADYGADYYAGEPAVTVNDFGQGQAYYVASRNDDRFIDDLAAGLIRRIGIQPNLEGDLPEGVTVQRRTNGKEDFLFVLNFVNEERTVSLGSTTFHNLLTDKTVTDELTLHAYGSTVLRRDSSKVSEAA